MVKNLLGVVKGLVDDVIIENSEGPNEKEKSILKNILESLIRLVSNHAVSVKAKAVELCQSLPVPRAEQERLNYKQLGINLLKKLNKRS